MPLTPQQQAALAAHVAADPTLSALPNNPGGWDAVAKALNVPASPAFTVWKTRVTEDEIFGNGIDWTRVGNLSVGKARIWEWMFKFGGANPSKQTVRDGIAAVWVGTAADLAVLATVIGHCKRAATRAEMLFATGAGTTDTPGTLTFEGQLSAGDVETALNPPA